MTKEIVYESENFVLEKTSNGVTYHYNILVKTISGKKLRFSKSKNIFEYDFINEIIDLEQFLEG